MLWWVRQRRKAAIRDAITKYALEAAGSGEDLDEALEAASLEAWRDLERPERR
jgi:hypothetical protein